MGVELLVGAALLCCIFKTAVGLATGGLGGPVLYCPQCAFVGQGKTLLRGCLAVELLLWCLLIVPGLAYSIWRIACPNRVCACCYHAELLALDTPLAIAARNTSTARGK
jgi:hypothetical protein